MKKTISTILMLCLLVALLPAFAAAESEFGQVTKVADMLYEVTFDEYSATAPDSEATSAIS